MEAGRCQGIEREEQMVTGVKAGVAENSVSYYCSVHCSPCNRRVLYTSMNQLHTH